MVILHSTETIALIQDNCVFGFQNHVSKISFKYVKNMTVTASLTYYTEKSGANKPSSQRTISFLNKRNSDLLLSNLNHGLCAE